MGCSPISKGFAFCSNIKAAGTKNFVYLLPLEDWLASTALTVDGTTGNLTALTLPETKELFKWEVGQPSNLNVNSTFTPVTGGLNGYIHNVDFRTPFIDQTQIDEITSMIYNAVVAFTPLNNGHYRLSGGWVDSDGNPQGIGLRMKNNDEILNDATIGGLIPIIIGTVEDGPKEFLPPFVVDKTLDLAALAAANVEVG